MGSQSSVPRDAFAELMAASRAAAGNGPGSLSSGMRSVSHDAFIVSAGKSPGSQSSGADKTKALCKRAAMFSPAQCVQTIGFDIGLHPDPALGTSRFTKLRDALCPTRCI